MREKCESKIFYVAFLNVIACIAVVFLHCNKVFWSRPFGRLWITSNVIETGFYWAVPIFFMNIGVTSLDFDKKYTIKNFLLRRFKRTGVPFIVWSFIGIFFHMIVKKRLIMYKMTTLIAGIINARWMGIYWFFIPLFMVYISIPVINSIEYKKREKIFRYIIAFGVIFNTIIPFLYAILGGTYNADLEFRMSGSFLIYCIIGYMLHGIYIKRKHLIIAIMCFVFGFMLQFIGTIYMTGASDCINKSLKGYLNISALTMSIGVFILGRYLCEKKWNDKLKCIIVELSKYTFGIYLVHYYFVLAVPKILMINIASIWWRTFGSIFIFGISLLVCFSVKKITFLKWLLP